MLATVSPQSLMVRKAVACSSSAAAILMAASPRIAWIFFSTSAPILSEVLSASKNATRPSSFLRNRACSAARRRVVACRARSRALTGNFLAGLPAWTCLRVLLGVAGRWSGRGQWPPRAALCWYKRRLWGHAEAGEDGHVQGAACLGARLPIGWPFASSSCENGTPRQRCPATASDPAAVAALPFTPQAGTRPTVTPERINKSYRLSGSIPLAPR